MTTRELIDLMDRTVSFPPGTANKRFVRDMAARSSDAPISERAEAYAWRIAYRFRRQLPKAVADEAVARKVEHRWDDSPETLVNSVRPRCSVCRQIMLSERERNAPCPGPPKPENRRRVVVEQRVADGVVAHDASIAAQEPLFGEGSATA